MFRRIFARPLITNKLSMRTFVTQINNKFDTLENCIPDQKKVNELVALQSQQTIALLERYKGMYVRKFDNIGYTVSRQSPESVVRNGGLLNGFAPCFSHYSNTFSLSVLPQVPFLFLPKSGSLSPLYLYAIPLKGEYIMPITSPFAEVIVPVLPVKSWWLTREIKNITNQVIQLGPLQGFYDLKCTAESEYFDDFLHNRLKAPASYVDIPHTFFSKQIVREAQEHYPAAIPRQLP